MTNVVRKSPTLLESRLLDLDVLIDRLGALPEVDQRPAADQDREVMTRIEELKVVAKAEFPVDGRDRPAELLTHIAEIWRQATAATHPQEWARAADQAGAILLELSDFVAVASRRPSVLHALSADVETVLRNAIARERRSPARRAFYDVPRAHVPGLPTEAFATAIQAVARALAERGLDEEAEPPVEMRLPLLERAMDVARTGAVLTWPRPAGRAIGLFSLTADDPSSPLVVYLLNSDESVSIRVLSPDLRDLVDNDLRDGVQYMEKRLLPSDGEPFLDALIARNANTSYVAWGELPREIA